MRKSVVLATLAVAGAGAAGLGAAVSINGSDTLADLTHDLVGPVVHTGTYSGPVCAANGFPNASSITFLGGGSGIGENNMQAGTQLVNPMTRFLKSAACTPAAAAVDAGASQQAANGIVIALDGVTNVVSQAAAGSGTCNGPVVPADCSPNATAGLAFTTVVPGSVRGGTYPTYTFGSWQDVLKVLYFGYVDKNFGHASDPDVGVNCNSNIRNVLANHWNYVMQSNCSAGNCTQIQHLFRRDDSTGTTDIFSSLLGQASPSATSNPVPANVASALTYSYGIGTDSFCNSLSNACQGTTSASSGACAIGSEWPGNNPGVGPNAVIPNDDQDYDPIRRPCQGAGTNLTVNNPTEQVCERGTFNASNKTWTAASLGLVLTMVNDTNAPSVVSNLGGPAIGTQFNTVVFNSNTVVNRCTGGTVFVQPIQVNKLTGAPGATNGYCPNGDAEGSNGVCPVPSDNNGNPNCLSFAADTPPAGTNCQSQGTSANNYGNSGAGVVCDSTAGSLNPQVVDPRVFNLYAYNFAGGVWVTTRDSIGRPLIGAYKRIHTSQSMYSSPSNTTGIVPGSGTPSGSATPQLLCNKLNVDDQIGCLVQASQCSMGYTGRGAEQSTGPNVSGSSLVLSANTTGLKILGVPDQSACIQTFNYRFSRKLYLNTMAGFDQVQNHEPNQWDLARCESNASLISGVALTNGFVALPDAGGPFVEGGVNDGLQWGAVVNGRPFCEDFNEGMLCNHDAGANVNACAHNDNTDGGIPGTAAGTSTVCGNGIVEPFEDCDNGTGNAAAPAACSTICRFNIL